MEALSFSASDLLIVELHHARKLVCSGALRPKRCRTKGAVISDPIQHFRAQSRPTHLSGNKAVLRHAFFCALNLRAKACFSQDSTTLLSPLSIRSRAFEFDDVLSVGG